jgi:hypothetical protein
VYIVEILPTTHVTRALNNFYTYALSIFLHRSESDSIQKFFKLFCRTDCVSPTPVQRKTCCTKNVKKCLSVLCAYYVDVLDIQYRRPAHSATGHARFSRKSAKGRAVNFSWARINMHLDFESTPEENLCTQSRSD